MILDNAQCITNDKSMVATAYYAIDTTYCWCLSDTPVMDNLRKLYLLLRFLRIQPCSDTSRINAVSAT